MLRQAAAGSGCCARPRASRRHRGSAASCCGSPRTDGESLRVGDTQNNVFAFCCELLKMPCGLPIRQAYRVACGCELLGAVEEEVEPAFEDVEILVLVGMDVRRLANRLKRRVPGEAVLGAALRHIGLAQDVPGNASIPSLARVMPATFGFHIFLPVSVLTWPPCNPWRTHRRISQRPSARSRSGICRQDAWRPWSGKSPGSDSRWC